MNPVRTKRVRVLNLRGNVVELEALHNELDDTWKTESGLSLVEVGGILKIKKEF